MRTKRVPPRQCDEDIQPVYKSPRYFSVNPETSFWTEVFPKPFYFSELNSGIRQLRLRRRDVRMREQHIKATLFASATGIGTAGRPQAARSDQESVDRKPSGAGVRVERKTGRDTRGMQGGTPVSEHPVEDPLLATDL